MKKKQKKQVKKWSIIIAIIITLISWAFYVNYKSHQVPDRPGEILYLSANQVSRWIKNKEIAFVQFSLPSCDPCFKSSPILKVLVEELHLNYAYVNVGNLYNEWLADELKVEEVPTIWAYIQGEPMGQIVGLKESEEYRAFFIRYLSAEK